MNKFFTAFFSIEKIKDGFWYKKQINFFGIKFKVKCYFKTFRKYCEQVYNNSNNSLWNNDLVNLLLSHFEDVDLMYIEVKNVLFIFSKKIFNSNAEFFHDFLLKHIGGFERFSFRVMQKSHPLYKEHIQYFKENTNVVCVRYVLRVGIIAKSIITKDDTGLFIEGEYLGTENYKEYNNIRYVNTPKRKLVDGVAVGDILITKSLEEQKEFLKKYFDWFFKTYESKYNKNMLVGKVVDCHLWNVLYENGKFTFIDFDTISTKDISKKYCLYYALSNGFHPLYNYFADLYKLGEIENNYVYPHIMEYNKNLIKARELNKKLIEKYFNNFS